MAHLFRPSSSVNNAPANAPATALRIQQSVQGRPRLIGWGRTRIAGNLLWYGDFQSYQIQDPSSAGGGGGKGGLFGGGQQSSGTTKTVYTASVIIGLCEGPIVSVGRIWNNKSQAQIVSPAVVLGWGATGSKGDQPFITFVGDYSQSPWGYMTSLHPGQDLNYRGDAYVAAGPLQLGESPDLPNLNFEVSFGFNPAGGDANPPDVIADFLTNSKYGVGLAATYLDDNLSYSNYCQGTGLVFSPTVSDQKAASDYLKDWMLATNSEFVWSSGVLKVIPYGDQAVGSYVPPAIIYAISDNDFVSSGSGSGAPISVTRARIEDAANSIQVEFLDGAADFNPAIAEWKDDAAIFTYGLRRKAVRQHHMFTSSSAAFMSAALEGGRELIRSQYTFTTQAAFILIDPMDIIEITDPVFGTIVVRVIEITEQDDYTLQFVCEDVLQGTAASPLYGAQLGSGFLPNYNTPPSSVTTAQFFEPTDQLAGALEVWGAVAGFDLSTWGGCEVWASWDDTTFAKIPDTIIGPSRMGVLTASLAAIPRPTQGPSLDHVHTLAVDLSISHGSLSSGSPNDNLAFGSLMWVNGELLSFETATPTGTYTFDLTDLNRNGFGTGPAAHVAGDPVVRVDQGVFKVPFDPTRVGQTLYLKFLSFNQFGGAKQGLADVGSVAYAIQGTALTSPLPDVVNFTSSYVGDITYLDWDIVTDFRSPVEYEIRKGIAWDSAQFVGTYAHPHVPAFGDATYWIKAVAQPVAGLIVYSAEATTIGINGSVIPG